MTRETLYDALTNVRDELVEEASETRPARRRVNWMKWGSIAAAAVLVVGAGAWWTLSHWHLGSSSAGGSGHDDGATVFTSYAGPVFPLTALDGGEGLTAERQLTYDFSPWIKTWWSNEDEANSRTALSDEERQEVLDNYNEWYPEGGRWLSSTDLLVTDGYTLENPTGEDRTVTLLYPFVSSLREVTKQAPTLTVDGEALDTVLHAGGYSGGFQAPGGSGEDGPLLNLAQLNSWEQYKTLLSDGCYLDAALGDYPDLSDLPVTVYKFADAYAPEVTDKDRDKVPNPSIRAMFDLDYAKTTVLSYGFSGGRFDWENGNMTRSFSIPRPGWRDYGLPSFLYILGDDIQNLATGGYVTGGTDEDTPILEGCGVTVERYETNLESALREMAELMYGIGDRLGDPNRPDYGDFELYFGLMKEFLRSYGALSGNGPERYGTGMLEETDFDIVDRVFYLETEVTVPAGGSAQVTARIRKDPSFDHYCAHTENRDIYGYDMVTRLGSSLDFTAQTARTEHTDGLEIVRQNYGFDWENGVDVVELDQSVEHYYLEVRRAETES